MTKKYVAVRMPKEAYKKIIVKKVRLEKVASELLGTPKRIPITRVLKIMADTPLILPDEKVKHIFRKKKND